jgi:hypothetical protein
VANDFITMVNRITTELRRSNLTTEAKQAINDAIDEASGTRFFLNETHGTTFNTVPGQEYYPDLGFVEVDAMYYFLGSGSRYNMWPRNNLIMDRYAAGNVSQGQLEIWSREGTNFRVYPIPTTVMTIYVDGYGKLSPFPLVADADTNNWMTYGERYIRALAKAIILKDIVRDYSEATVMQAIAEDLQDQLLSETTTRIGTGYIIPTRF